VNQRLFDDRSDLNNMLGQSPETSFLGASPTPTPTPAPRSYFGFRFPNNPRFNLPTTGLPRQMPPTPFPVPTPSPTPTPPNPWQDWHQRYGFNF
jgi:hypothetical protein